LANQLAARPTAAPEQVCPDRVVDEKIVQAITVSGLKNARPENRCLKA